MYARESASGWNPGGLTWNNQPAPSGAVSSVVAANGYTGCPAAWVNLPVTGQVQDWANGSADNGLILTSVENNSYGWKIFSSGDDGANVAPALSITYSNCTSYSSPATGTHQVCGAIRDKYQALGGPSGFLGYPTTNELGTPDGIGRYNHFQKANGYHSPVDGNTGSIYWTPNYGAWSIQGAIRDEWASIGWQASPVGYPTTDRMNLPSRPGTFNHFNVIGGYTSSDGKTGSIYWSAGTGAHAIYGAIRQKWLTMGFEQSYLGLPTSDEFAIPGGRRNNLEGGQINWVSTSNGYGQIEATNGPTAGAGTPGEYTYDSHTLSDNLKAKVNVGTGNLNVTMGLLGVPGISGDTTLSIAYNSADQSPQAAVHGSAVTGLGWRIAPFGDVSLVTYPDGSASYYAGDGASYTFLNNNTPTLTEPTGINATLSHPAGQDWKLTDHGTGGVLDFGPNGGGVLSQADRNGNTITYTYQPGTPDVTTITGTRDGGNPITLTYGGTCPAQMLCSAAQTADGVTHSFAFAYNTGTNTTLASVTEHATGNSQVPIPADRVTRFGYDTAGDLTSIVDPAGVATTVGYSSDGQAKVTSFDQDSSGIAATTTYDYTSSPGNTLLHDPDSGAPYNHAPTTYGIDGFGRVIKTTDPMGNSRNTKWNPSSNVTSSMDANSQITTFGYDANNNLTNAAIPTGASASATYNGPQAYQPDTSNDAQGNHNAYTYDQSGNPTGATTTNPQNNQPPVTTSATYNPTNPTCGGKPGEQCTSKDGNGNTTTYAYDSTGNLTTSTPPAGGALKASTYTTNGSGKTATVTDGNGQTTTSIDDAFGRLAKITVGTSTVAYGYDPDGRTTSRTDPSGTTTYGLDHLGRQTSEQLSNEPVALSATYDPAGNTLTYADQTGTVTYAYNADNKIISAADPGGSCTTNPTTLCTTFGYDNNGTRNKTTYPGGVTMNVTADNSGRTREINATNGSGTLYDYKYGYVKGTVDQTLIQNRTDITTSPNPAVNYHYDNLNELTSAIANTGTNPPTASWLYCYDNAGNRIGDSTNIGATCPTITGAGSNTYGYDPTNALTTKNGTGSGFAYDNNGNQTSGADSQTITAGSYSGYNQLSGLSANGTPSTYGYAGTTNAERTTITTGGTTTTTGNGLFGMVNQTTGAATTGYTRDPNGTLIDERTPTGTYYYLYDGTGSVIGLSDSTGTRVNSYAYDPYGNTTASTGPVANPYQFEAGYHDSTGLYHFGARYYDPATGRWTQLDPTGRSPGYAYAGDNPVNNADTSGTVSLSFGSNIYFTFTPSDIENLIVGVSGISGTAAGVGLCGLGGVTAVVSFLCGAIGFVAGYIVGSVIYNAVAAPALGGCSIQVSIPYSLDPGGVSATRVNCP